MLVQSQIGKINIYDLIFEPFKSFGQVRLFKRFWKKCPWSLCDQKDSETVILWNISTIKKKKKGRRPGKNTTEI